MITDAWKSEFAGRRILIWGYGREGQSSLRWIRRLHPDLPLDIADSGDSPALKAASEMPGVRVFREADTDFSAYDRILKSPGVVIPAGMDPSNITQQSHLFLKHHRHQTVGITGTKGKSTTTSLLYSVLSACRPAHLVGNIGIPCFDILETLQPEDTVAFEISCHQLRDCLYSPHVGVYLNLYEEHLDQYESFQAYGEAKANVFRHQEKGDIAILWEKLPFVSERPDAWLIGRDIAGNESELRCLEHHVRTPKTRLIGSHNLQNLAVVYAICLALGIGEEEFIKGAEQFEPLHHRLELIGERNGIRFVNDSISTIGQTAIAALEALPETDVILIGGKDRGIGYGELEDVLSRRRDLWVVFMYASGKRVYDELRASGRLHERMIVADDLEKAVRQGAKLCRPGHILLLSPAASSYDHFRNFEHRGEVFEELVKTL